MLVLLPPSETKSAGGSGPALDLDALGFATLNPLRRKLADALVELAADRAASAAALKLGPKQSDEIDRNAALWSGPTRPAIDRYTGVLYDALHIGSLSRAKRDWACARLAIGSALFGVLDAADPIPAYRLSAGSQLPGQPTLRALWKADLTQALALQDRGLVVDLRSGAYAALGDAAAAVSVSVVTEHADGSRSVVSHFSKHHKGVLARALVTSRAEPTNTAAVARVARRAGMRVEVAGADELVIVT